MASQSAQSITSTKSGGGISHITWFRRNEGKRCVLIGSTNYSFALFVRDISESGGSLTTILEDRERKRGNQ